MILLLQFIFFIVLFYIVIYAPGRYLLRVSKLLFPPVIRVTLSMGVGIATFLLVAYLLAWIKLDYVALLIMGLLTLFDQGKAMVEIFHFVKKMGKYKAEIVLTMLGVIGMCYLTWRSGVVEHDQYIFYGINAVDSLYHLALIGNLAHAFPPEHFGLSGVPLRGYHFFYDFLIALFAKYFHFQITDLYLRFFPVITSLFFALSFISLSEFFDWKRITRIGIIFSIFFFGNFEFFFNYFVHTEFLAHIPEGVTQILDPSVPLSLALFICGFLLLQRKDKSLLQSVLAATVIGILPMVKVYTALLFFVGFGTILLWSFYKREYRQLLSCFILSGIVAFVAYAPINLGAGNFIFAPFIYIRHLMEGASIFQAMYWPVEYQIFQDHHNYPHMAFIVVVITGLFLFETLGWRLPIGIAYFWQRRKKIKIDEKIIFWTIVFLTGGIIPLIFIQSSSVFNIVQFYWIILALSIPFFVMQLNTISEKLSKATRIGIWLVIILTSIPSSFLVFAEYSVNPTRIDADTTLMTRKIAEFLPSDQELLVLDKKDYTTVPLIAALTSHSVYLENEGIDFGALQNKIYDRQAKLDRILVLAQDCKGGDKLNEMRKIISSTHIKYILTFRGYSCFQPPTFRGLTTTGDQQVIEFLK